MTQLPNFPAVEDTWAPSFGANGGAMPSIMWVDLNPRTRYATSIKRGKQYELDQTQAGELSVTLNNTDGALDPLNTASPWAGQIKPYSPFRHRAQWSPTVNLLPQGIASGGEGSPAGAVPSSFGMTFPTYTITATIAALGAGVAYEESNAFSFAIPSGVGVNSGVMRWDSTSIVPGQTYTFSLYVANTTASTSVTLLPYIDWLSSTGSAAFGNGAPVAVSGVSGNPAWQRIVVTATAPTTGNVYGIRLGMNVGATTTAATQVYVDGIQLEKGSSASAWVYPGYWYGQFAGFVERWTPQYQDAGTRAEAQVTAVDAFALFSQRTLNDALTEEINLLNPRFLYRMNDPAGSTTANDATGANKPAPMAGAAAGTAPYGFGQAITATNTTTGTWYGSDTVLTISNPTPGFDPGVGGGSAAPTEYVALHSAGIKGPANPNLWTRMVAFRTHGALGNYPAPSSSVSKTARLWYSCDNATTPSASGPSPSGANIDVNMQDGTGGMYWSAGGYYNFYGNSMQFAGTANPTDGNWHLAIFGMDANGGQMLASLDGVTTSAYTTQTWAPGTTSSPVPTGLKADTIGAMVSLGGGNWADFSFAGDIAMVAEFPTLLTASQISNLYTAWRNAGTGDSTDQRYARILRYVGYNGPTNLDSGTTRSMGPADFSGADALSALQAVVDTETGSHWIQGDGTPRFRSRASKYAQLTPALVFGDGAGEIHYEDVQLDFDPTHLANVVQVTQTNSQQVFTAQDATSIANYFTRLLTRTVNSTSAAECQDCASYLVSRYKNPLMRVSSIKVNVGAQSGAWSSLLPLDLGTRVRVMRRPLGCPAIQVDCFIEQMTWDYDTAGNGTLTMQLSPADAIPSAMFAAWRTTLNQAVAVGATSITINAPTFDNQTPLAAQIGVGQQIVVGTGGPVPEVMTVQAVSATSPGWTTGVITFTSATAHSHTAGFNVTEMLPTSLTTTTTFNTWDVAATANSINFAY